MKRINKSIIVFVIVFAIIGVGFLKLDFVGSIRNSLSSVPANIKTKGVFDSVKTFTSEIDSISSEQLSYHDLCIDINSIYTRSINKRIVEKDDETIVKMDNGMLAEEVDRISDKSISDNVKKIKKLQDDTGVPVIYVMAPQKGYKGGLPTNANNYINDNCDRFITQLKNNKLNYLDLRENMDSQDLTEENSFFATDHHWKPQTGLWATNEICSKLKSDYDFKYEASLLNLDNYTIETKENSFLGSEGKKAGIYFTKFGLENFDLIYPKFKTKLVVDNVIENKKFEGDFVNSVLNLEHLNYDSPYNSWLYSTYSDGDNALQVIENKLNNGKNLMVIRDSFAGVVTPYLSLSCKYLHAIDLRTDVIGTNRVKSVSQYAKKIKPDYILIIYKTVKTDNCYDFR